MTRGGRTVEPTAEIRRPEAAASALASSAGENTPASSEPSSSPVAEPRALGRYRLRYRVATGGMASVYLAQLASERGFRKWVALKTIHPHIATNAKFVQMFFNEARLAARLDHPNVCQVFDFGEADGTYYLAMEYLHGEALSSVLRRAWRKDGVPYEVAARIVADVARGLHAAHELKSADGTNAGVVHRDVSPQNVFVLYNGVAKIVDFGIARSREHEGEHTQTGELKGKIAYMAPEQVQHGLLDRRADIWSLGVVLWELSAGQRLFKRANDAQSLLAIISGEIKRPSDARAGYPEALEQIVLRALAVDPDARYATAAEFARALEGFVVQHGAPASASEVAEFMTRLFADQRALREQLLYRDDGGGEAAGGGAGGLDAGSNSSVVFRGMTLPPPPGPRAGAPVITVVHGSGGGDAGAAAASAEGAPSAERVSSESVSGARVSPERARAESASGELLVTGTGRTGLTPPGNVAASPSITPPPSVVPPSVAPSLAPPLPTADDAAGEYAAAVPIPPAPLVPAAHAAGEEMDVVIGLDGGLPHGVAPSRAAARRQQLTIGLVIAGAAAVSLAVGVGLGRSTSSGPPGASAATAPPAAAIAAQVGSGPAAGATNPGALPTAPSEPPSGVGAPAVLPGAGGAPVPAAPVEAAAQAPEPAPAGPSAPGTGHAAAASAAAATTRPSSGAGFLNLFAIPSAEVFDGRRSLGFTPIANRALPPGVHTLRLVPTTGQPPRTLTVTITPGATAAHSVRWH